MRKRPAGQGLQGRLIVGLLCLCVARLVLAAEPPRLVAVEPDRDGDLLMCRLMGAGLPGEKIALSLESGLVSSLELLLDLRDERSKVLAGNRVSVQIAFDLWEEIFSVAYGQTQQRFADGDALAQFLNDLPRLPVASVGALDPNQKLQIHVGLWMHPIAPSERERVANVIVGETRSSSARGGTQELSVSLGRLIRAFYKDRPGQAPPHCEVLSPWFRLQELIDAQD